MPAQFSHSVRQGRRTTGFVKPGAGKRPTILVTALRIPGARTSAALIPGKESGGQDLGSKPNAKLTRILNEIRSGTIDSQIMKKHKLSSTELRAIFKDMLESGAITLPEIFHRPVWCDPSVETETARRIPRQHLAFLLPVHDVTRPQLKGWVGDITEEGLGVHGLRASPGEIVQLVLTPLSPLQDKEIRFEAECRWASEDAAGRPSAGFRIRKISREGLERLRLLLKHVTIKTDEEA